MNEAEKLINKLYGEGTIGFTCDVCGRKVNGCSIVNGMKFCAKCYQETFGKDNQQNEIQQLKRQLEEKDNLIEFGKEEIRKRNKRIDEIVERDKKLFYDKNKELEKLKQQLEEKDKEVTDLEKENGILTNLLATKPTEIELDELYTQLKEKDKEIEQYKSNQKVISLHSAEDWYNRFIDTTTQNIKLELNQKQLAIQELEKVKILLQNAVNYEGYTFIGIYDAVNNQIKELKGE